MGRVVKTAAIASAAGAVYLGGSFAAAAAMAEFLIAPRGLQPAEGDREDFRERLRRAGPIFDEFDHGGDPRDPAILHAAFASPGGPSSRPTVVFLHGKGGNAAEWTPDAIRALAIGLNVLVPDLRGHGPSQGRYFTYGLLERADVESALAAARERHGLDATRIGLHACSAGGTVALQMAADNPAVRALWLESPFGNSRAMARHYLHFKTRLPAFAVALTASWSLLRADAVLRRRLGLAPGRGLASISPVEAARRIRCPVQVVRGLRDELVPPELSDEIVEALPRQTAVWSVETAGHCHHDDEPLAVERNEYERRWREFFERFLGHSE
jgi:pimeloyl-ACP methyl ester carboxylesterase